VQSERKERANKTGNEQPRLTAMGLLQLYLNTTLQRIIKAIINARYNNKYILTTFRE
jgi:hypothetical protein